MSTIGPAAGAVVVHTEDVEVLANEAAGWHLPADASATGHACPSRRAAVRPSLESRTQTGGTSG